MPKIPELRILNCALVQLCPTEMLYWAENYVTILNKGRISKYFL